MNNILELHTQQIKKQLKTKYETVNFRFPNKINIFTSFSLKVGPLKTTVKIKRNDIPELNSLSVSINTQKHEFFSLIQSNPTELTTFFNALFETLDLITDTFNMHHPKFLHCYTLSFPFASKRNTEDIVSLFFTNYIKNMPIAIFREHNQNSFPSLEEKTFHTLLVPVNTNSNNPFTNIHYILKNYLHFLEKENRHIFSSIATYFNPNNTLILKTYYKSNSVTITFEFNKETEFKSMSMFVNSEFIPNKSTNPIIFQDLDFFKVFETVENSLALASILTPDTSFVYSELNSIPAINRRILIPEMLKHFTLSQINDFFSSTPRVKPAHFPLQLRVVEIMSVYFLYQDFSEKYIHSSLDNSSLLTSIQELVATISQSEIELAFQKMTHQKNNQI